MKNKKFGVDVSIIAPLITLIIFSVCVLFVLLFGAKLYKEALERDKVGFETRTANQYITTRFRQGDGEELSFISDFESSEGKKEGDTLFFVEVVNGERYFTRIYCYDGYLYELFSAAEDEFERGDGEPILPLNDIHFEEENGIITVIIDHLGSNTDILKLVKRSDIGGNYEK